MPSPPTGSNCLFYLLADFLDLRRHPTLAEVALGAFARFVGEKKRKPLAAVGIFGLEGVALHVRRRGDPPHLEPVLVETQVFVFFVLDFVQLDFVVHFLELLLEVLKNEKEKKIGSSYREK